MRTHEQAIHDQFDSRAQAYLNSPVHAHGPDLAHARERVATKVCSGLGLDVGCGAGHLSFALAPSLKQIVALDPSPGMLAAVAQAAAARGFSQILTRQGGAESLPFPGGTFDVVGTRFSAHHWRYLERGLREMYRVLKPGAYVLAIDSVGHEDPLVDTHLQSIELLRDPSHVRNRSVSQWQAMLESAGFVDIELAQWPLRLEFGSWVERMRTPPGRVTVIRELQRGAAREVHDALALEADGSFSLQAGAFWARKGA